jgi:predicted RecA/RadA family phage recombinase
MATNEIYRDGFSLSYKVNSAVESGMFVTFGATAGTTGGAATGIVGVAETDAELGADGNYYATLRSIGVFTGTTSSATAPGTPMYLASGATYGTALTTTVGSNIFVGYAINTKGATAGDAFVRVNN